MFPEIDDVQFRGRRIVQNRFGDLLVGAFVFVFGQSFGELAEVFHRVFFAMSPPPVDASCDVAQLPAGKADKRMRDDLQLRGFGHVHGQIFQFRQMRIMSICGLRI